VDDSIAAAKLIFRPEMAGNGRPVIGLLNAGSLNMVTDI
jgi:hypothetical protein